MKIKKDANIQGLDIRMRRALIAADNVWKDFGQELVITSGLDGEHSAGSFHYYGLALDFRTRYFSEKDKESVFIKLKKILGHRFDVVKEPSHIHVEYDV